MDQTNNGVTPFWEENNQETPFPIDINVNKNTLNSPSISKNNNCCKYSRNCCYKWFLILIYLLFIIYGVIILIIAIKNKKEGNSKPEKKQYQWFIVSLVLYGICDILSLIIILFTNYLDSITFSHKLLVKLLIPFEIIYYLFFLIPTAVSMSQYKSRYREIIGSFLFLHVFLRLVQFTIEYNNLELYNEYHSSSY